MKKLLSFLVVFVLSCYATAADDTWDDEIGKVIEAHQRLKAAVVESEGSIEIDRTGSDEKLVPYIKGKFFKGTSSFRADFEAWDLRQSGGGAGERQLIALDRKHSYQMLAMSVDTKSAILYVRSASYPDVSILVDTVFNPKINSLWSAGGRPIVDIIQQPNASFEIADSDGISKALVVTVSEQGSKARYTLDSEHEYACRRALVETDFQIGVDIAIELTILPDGGIVPSQLHEKGFTDSEYREETTLAFSLPAKDLPKEFSNDSFLDFGVDYEVSEEDQMLEGRYFGADWSNYYPNNQGSPSYFWIVAASLVAVGLALVFRVWRKRRIMEN